MSIRLLFVTAALTTIIHHSASIQLFSQEQFKSVRLLGLTIIQEETLVMELGLNRLPRGTVRFNAVSVRIRDYLHTRGYTIAVAHLVRETPEELIVFIDEGAIDRILFLNMNSINTLRLRYELKLKNDIYNTFSIEKSLSEFKQRFKFKDAKAKLVEVRDYDNSFFQIDRRFIIPLVGTSKLPFFNEYRPRYDLHIDIERFRPDEEGGLTYGLKTSYSKGLRPHVSYFVPSWIGRGDRLNLEASAGIFYGMDLEPQNPPRWTYMEFSAEYGLPPTFEQFFTPSVKGYAYRSWSSRKDLGLDQYEYLILQGSLSPGITLLDRLKIYAGYGAERVFIYDSKADPDADFTVEVMKRTDDWAFFELGFRFNLFPWSIRHLIERRFRFSYNYYMNSTSFQKLVFDGSLGFEFDNFDVFSLNMDSVWFYDDPPFYHEESVDNENFKGFMGRSYHSIRVGRISGEYRFSVFRDYVFTGIYADGTVFLGSEYDLTGRQTGAAGGISGHFLFLDQFEFNIYFGRDRLFSTGESQYNIYLNFEKKW